MQLQDEVIEYRYTGVLAPTPESWTPLAEVQAKNLLSPARLRSLLPILNQAKSQVASEREFTEAPAELRPLDSGFIMLPQTLLDAHRRKGAESELGRILARASSFVTKWIGLSCSASAVLTLAHGRCSNRCAALITMNFRRGRGSALRGSTLKEPISTRILCKICSIYLRRPASIRMSATNAGRDRRQQVRHDTRNGDDIPHSPQRSFPVLWLKERRGASAISRAGTVVPDGFASLLAAEGFGEKDILTLRRMSAGGFACSQQPVCYQPPSWAWTSALCCSGPPR